MILSLLLALAQDRIELKDHGSFYLAQRPSAYVDTQAWPAIVELHGSAGTLPGLKEAAEKKGYLLLRPQARGAAWGGRNAGRDAAFVAACLDDAKTRWRVDPERVLVAGLGEGADLAGEVAGLHGDALAGCAVVHPREGKKMRPGVPWLVLLPGGGPRVSIEGDGDLTFREAARPGRPECDAMLQWFEARAKPRANMDGVDEVLRKGRYLDASLLCFAFLDQGREARRVRFVLDGIEAAGAVALGKIELEVASRKYVDALLRCRRASVQFAWLPVGEKLRKRLTQLEADPRVKKALEAAED